MVSKRVITRKFIWIGLLTIAATVIVNLLIRAVTISFFGVSEAFRYLQMPIIISSTIVFVLLALLSFGLVKRYAQHPIRFYRILAFIVLCISLLSPVMALTGLFPAPGMTVAIFWTMITLHIVSAIVIVGLLTTLARE